MDASSIPGFSTIYFLRKAHSQFRAGRKSLLSFSALRRACEIGGGSREKQNSVPRFVLLHRIPHPKESLSQITYYW